jgi:type II secretory pathway component PulF
MTPPRPDPRPEEAWAGLIKALGILVAIVAAVSVLFFLYFILPKIEVGYKDSGARMPTPIVWVSIAGYYFFKYFWLIAAAIEILYVWGRAAGHRDGGPARD